MENKNIGKDNVYKWALLGFLWGAYFLQQGTRQIYNAILPQIKSDFNVDSVQLGLVSTIFIFSYGLCVPFTGIVSDVLSRKWVVVSGVVIFSCGIFCSGLVAGIGLIVITYGLINAVGQSFYYPPASSLLGQFHSQMRSTALSILQTAQYAGIVICSCVAGYLADLKSVETPGALSHLFGGAAEISGWRLPFIIFGAIGVFWAVCLAVFVRNTKQEESLPENSEARQKPTFTEAVKAICTRPSALLLAVVFGFLVYIDTGFKTWMPTYLHETFKMNLGDAAFHAVIWHYAGAFVGVVIGSRICDKLFARVKNIRFVLNLIGFAGIAPFMLFMVHTGGNLNICIAGLLLFGFFKGVCDSCIFASILDVVPARYRASGMGIMICGGFFIGSTSSTILGFIRDHFNLTVGISSLSMFSLANVIVLAVIIRFFFKRDYVES